jgi:hypothetical protein
MGQSRAEREGERVIRKADKGDMGMMEGYSGGEGIEGADDSCDVWARVDETGWSDVDGWVAGTDGQGARGKGQREAGTEEERAGSRQ